MSQQKPFFIIDICYYATVGLFAVGFFFPQLRLWGVNLWAYFPAVVVIPALVVVLALPVIIRFGYSKHQRDIREKSYKRKWWHSFALWSAVIAVGFGVAFYLLRVKLHFLGDGYTLIANLASDSPILKLRNFGEMVIHQFVFNLLGGEGERKALLAYQIVSFVGGFAFIAISVFSARLLFEKTGPRLLFLLGLLSGGYVLLFFGYAEDYSLFVPSVALFGLTGILISTGRLNRWFILAPLVMSIFLHAFGLILIPSAFYLLFAGTRTGETIANFKAPVKALIVASALALMGAVFCYFYVSSHFFRLAFLPLWEGEFTLEGYTLLSWNHIVDILNLLILLLPAFPLILVALWFTRNREMWRCREMIFLTLLLVSALAAVVLLDPKLGMARDWDLFAFAGVVVVLWSFYVLLKSGTARANSSVVAMLAVTLGACSLGARVAGQADSNIALAQVVDCAKLDKKKNMFSLFQMHDYCWKNTDYRRSPLFGFDWDGNFPEWGFVQTGLKLKSEGNCRQAMPLFWKAIREHPGLALAYYGTGSCYLNAGDLDSAVHYLEIADGLNPHDIHTHNDLAHAYIGVRNFDLAEIHFEKAISIDNGNIKAYLNFAEFLSLSGQDDKCFALLREVASRNDAPPEVFKRLGDYYLRQRFFDEAEREYRTALQKGLPRSELESLLKTYPELKL